MLEPDHGHTEVARMLLDAGADPTAADENGKECLKMTQEAGKPEIEALVRKASEVRSAGRPKEEV